MKQTNHIFASISSSRTINGLTHIMVCTLHRNDKYELNYDDIERRMCMLGIKQLTLIRVKEDNSTISTMGEKGSEDSSLLRVIILSEANFFTANQIIQTLISEDSEYKNIIIEFENLNWNQILIKFRKFDVILSGGSNTKRHLISPVQYRLSMFIACTGIDGYYSVKNSFHLNNKKRQNMGANLATPEFKRIKNELYGLSSEKAEAKKGIDDSDTSIKISNNMGILPKAVYYTTALENSIDMQQISTLFIITVSLILLFFNYFVIGLFLLNKDNFYQEFKNQIINLYL